MNNLEQLSKLVRYFILKSTTAAGSGHPTSSMSATDIMVQLMFGGFFKAELDNPQNPNNDRLIFSKGHASPLFYSLYTAAGHVTEEELMTLRKKGSRLEGHPTMAFPYTEAGTGSLGQGLSIGVGQALNAKLDNLNYRTFVLMGDSEMAEGSVWEALASASFYKLNNLVAIVDVNRLGQRGETMYGHHTEVYEERLKAFGWDTQVIDGHNFEEIESAFKHAEQSHDKPFAIIAKTLKGKGVSFIEDKDNWHGKALNAEELELALKELGEVDKNLRGEVGTPEPVVSNQYPVASVGSITYNSETKISTRKAYGEALVRVAPAFPEMVVLDAEVSNSTYADIYKKAHGERFFEMYIAEQNMVGIGQGFSARGKIPFVSTFAAFFTRAADQIRMSQYGNGNIKFVGSHSGVSIGEDGASQMALEDISLFRAVLNSVVLYPSDGVSTHKLVELAAKHKGNVYIRTTRMDAPILYPADEEFVIGGSKTLKSSDSDVVTVIGAGVTLHEALKAYEELKKEGINIRVVDLYSVKPLDAEMLKKAVEETKAIITVEDHHHEGGIGEAVMSVFHSLPLSGEGKGGGCVLKSLAVSKMPMSAKPQELLDYEEISSASIVSKIKAIL